jgi:hypothetical protein
LGLDIVSLSLCTFAIYSYSVLNLLLELYHKVLAVLRHAILVVRLERTDHVRIVPIGLHSRLGYVVRKELEPEQPRRSRTSTRDVSCRNALLKKRPESLFVCSASPYRCCQLECLPRCVSQSAGCVAVNLARTRLGTARSQRCRYQTVA